MKLGQTKVRVMRREENGSTRELHRGIVVEIGSSFARVYNPAPQNEGGDASQTTAEYFPMSGKNCWIEETGELDKPILLAAELR